MDRPSPAPEVTRSRPACLLMAIGVMAAGLLWRSRFISLPPFMAKYGGDALWALMIFFGFGLVFRRMPTIRLACVSLGFAWGIEFSQLYHAPWIDAVRSVRVGRLVLGSTFNWPDLLAYPVGILIGVAVERALLKRSIRRRPWRGRRHRHCRGDQGL